MPRPAAKVAKALLKKGMVSEESHHTIYRKQVDGVTTLVTRISHSSTEISNTIGNLMARQCALQLREFWDLVDCPLTEEEWNELIAERCQGGRNPYLNR